MPHLSLRYQLGLALVVVNVLLTALMYVAPEKLAGALNVLFLLALIFTPSAAIKAKPLDV